MFIIFFTVCHLKMDLSDEALDFLIQHRDDFFNAIGFCDDEECITRPSKCTRRMSDGFAAAHKMHQHDEGQPGVNHDEDCYNANIKHSIEDGSDDDIILADKIVEVWATAHFNLVAENPHVGLDSFMKQGHVKLVLKKAATEETQGQLVFARCQQFFCFHVQARIQATLCHCQCQAVTNQFCHNLQMHNTK